VVELSMDGGGETQVKITTSAPIYPALQVSKPA
jgi:hypothetical protein